jgi:hypothetical protein
VSSLVDIVNLAPSLGLAAAIFGAVRLVTWLIGLIIVLRDCPPEQRPKILRAYGASQPRNRVRALSGSIERQGNRDDDS